MRVGTGSLLAVTPTPAGLVRREVGPELALRKKKKKIIKVFYDFSIFAVGKPDNNMTKKRNRRSVFLMNIDTEIIW